ncbi:hypothetical protein AHIS1636_31850 [Arthrobacter mangrovi]|uniref:Helix-hairpin-helix domain-containing protein n=1 Tax=Arthrobacter mangrovi TaxID=2966350 RepID=A0ABQ5MXV2_9MICC|nr:hypothetical protein AHIS1636_31850 [Arthrobacter mangrovi]
MGLRHSKGVHSLGVLLARCNTERMQPDRGPTFAGINVGRPAAGALIDAGYSSISDLPEDLEELKRLHGIGPKAIRLLRTAREQGS